MIDLDAIRARNDVLRDYDANRQAHDGRDCFASAVVDIDALLAEVTELREIVNELGAYPDLSAHLHRRALDRRQARAADPDD